MILRAAETMAPWLVLWTWAYSHTLSFDGASPAQEYSYEMNTFPRHAST
jgi:hypothetical protein